MLRNSTAPATDSRVRDRRAALPVGTHPRAPEILSVLDRSRLHLRVASGSIGPLDVLFDRGAGAFVCAVFRRPGRTKRRRCHRHRVGGLHAIPRARRQRHRMARRAPHVGRDAVAEHRRRRDSRARVAIARRPSRHGRRGRGDAGHGSNEFHRADAERSSVYRHSPAGMADRIEPRPHRWCERRPGGTVGRPGLCWAISCFLNEACSSWPVPGLEQPVNRDDRVSFQKTASVEKGVCL